MYQYSDVHPAVGLFSHMHLTLKLDVNHTEDVALCRLDESNIQRGVQHLRTDVHRCKVK